MKLRKLDISYIHDWPEDPGLKGACVLLPGALYAAAETSELPAGMLHHLPAVILCTRCDSYLERLCNERGIAVTSPADPVASINAGAEVEVDLLAGTLVEPGSGRRFALHPLKASHVQAIRAHG